MSKETTIEQDFESLEKLLSDLSKDDIGIEEAFNKYSEGMKILKNCDSKIDKVEKEVMKISEDMKLEVFE